MEKTVLSVRLRLISTEGKRSEQVNPTFTDQGFMSRQEIGMSPRSKKVLSTLAAAGLMGLGFAATKPALATAGTNGQKIKFCANGSDYRYVHVEGDNQNGEFMQYGIPVELGPNKCDDQPIDIYWVGNVKLTWMESASGDFPDQETTCYIPQVSSKDTITCTPKALL
jgi:hypothetical protein